MRSLYPKSEKPNLLPNKPAVNLPLPLYLVHLSLLVNKKKKKKKKSYSEATLTDIYSWWSPNKSGQTPADSETH